MTERHKSSLLLFALKTSMKKASRIKKQSARTFQLRSTQEVSVFNPSTRDSGSNHVKCLCIFSLSFYIFICEINFNIFHYISTVQLSLLCTILQGACSSSAMSRPRSLPSVFTFSSQSVHCFHQSHSIHCW